MCEKFNSFTKKFPIPATLFQKLEKQGGVLQAGDVLLRQSLECIVPLQGARSTWFASVARQVNIPPRRVKSLFYNRQCRVWGEELARINGALAKAVKPQNIEMLDALNANAETRARMGELDKIKKEIRGEIMEDIRTLLLELLGSGSGVPVRVDSKAVRRR